ncbi:MATE family efflux transporter [Ramlibacter tataouinensis]|uniref:Candidate membrane protein, related to cation efflux system protein n=1 Tax=Ramlibacter tataouinensis (strain ATCC BAA-407 / DSM 14655 / LMG 21543 / TTB310) TaxID=365046 RepID=F5Y109_RAMTT|nr:MATE family efflux transporter [Ramlibacter tataouinensis]AEG92227.1 candidate membrane protein, related to cation efflux system protein [Ramlibacter tataouinensis TTB310]
MTDTPGASARRMAFWLVMMQMMSAGAMGGGVASAIARALGAQRRADADALAVHALVLALGFALLFTVGLWLGGPALYRQMGGSGASLQAALTYSNWVFAGALVVWLFNSLAAVVRGTGNMALPAIVTSGGLFVLIPLSPLLIFGWGPVPALGIAGGAVALLVYYAGGMLALALYLRSPRSLIKPSLHGGGLRWPLARDILRVGLVATVSALATNLTIGIATALVGRLGPAAIAGYGTASRLEYLLVPLVFGLGAPLVAMVGTCIGAGRRERALQATWVGALIAGVLCEAVGLAAACFPRPLLSLFGSDPAMLEAGSRYLQIVGPAYGFFGFGLALYFASQGAGRLAWPLLGNVVRLAVAGGVGWLALAAGAGLAGIFAAQAVALLLYGAVNGLAIAGGAWFGWPGRPRAPAYWALRS